MINRLLLSLLLCSITFPALAEQALVAQVKQQTTEQAQHDKAREAKFEQLEKTLLERKNALLAQKKQLDEQNQLLSQTFTSNEKQLADLEQKLRLEMGSLGEVFGVARQNAKLLNNELNQAVNSVANQASLDTVSSFLDEGALPTIEQLVQLWRVMEKQAYDSEISKMVLVDYVSADGKVESKKVLKLGAFALVGEQGYLHWDGKQAQDYINQPKHVPKLSDLNSEQQGDHPLVLIDPTRGQVLQQYAYQPTLMDRIEAGGVVGGVIITLMVVGLGIAAVRGVIIFNIRRKVAKQLSMVEPQLNNPLGRVIAVYDVQKPRSLEALELRLLEVILDEQAKLEIGLSMLKLLAALAPMLGLLGTVTGMIETFQVITLFGAGDAKVMAGGISMALVTTVMGLIAAMPLLLAHNVLSTQAENLRNVLEKQGVALVAQQAEQGQTKPVVA